MALSAARLQKRIAVQKKSAMHGKDPMSRRSLSGGVKSMSQILAMKARLREIVAQKKSNVPVKGQVPQTSLSSGVISISRALVMKARLRRELLLRKVASISESDLKRLFAKADRNSDGFLSRKECGRVLKKICGRKLEPNGAFVLRTIDVDKNGGVSHEEFMKFIKRSQTSLSSGVKSISQILP